jgi:uncharacterized membrane protein (UPF0127 family)
MSRLLRLGLVSAAVASVACGKTGDNVVSPPQTSVNVVFSGATITAEIAATGAARETGLMGRTSLGTNAGMLFVFPTDQQPEFVAFWMKDTPLPLSIAFMDAAQHVLAVQEMAPFDTINLHRPASLYRYALEANQGWFTTHGVTAGSVATFTLPAGIVISP